MLYNMRKNIKNLLLCTIQSITMVLKELYLAETMIIIDRFNCPIVKDSVVVVFLCCYLKKKGVCI